MPYQLSRGMLTNMLRMPNFGKLHTSWSMITKVGEDFKHCWLSMQGEIAKPMGYCTQVWEVWKPLTYWWTTQMIKTKTLSTIHRSPKKWQLYKILVSVNMLLLPGGGGSSLESHQHVLMDGYWMIFAWHCNNGHLWISDSIELMFSDVNIWSIHPANAYECLLITTHIFSNFQIRPLFFVKRFWSTILRATRKSLSRRDNNRCLDRTQERWSTKMIHIV